MDVRTTGSQSAGSMPKEETSNKANNSVSNGTWLKLKGPAAESLSRALFGPAVVVLQKNKGARSVAEAPEEDAAMVPIALVQEAEGGGVVVTGRGGTTVSVSPTRIFIAGTAGAGKSIKVLKTHRIVLLGRAGAGKSSLANTIFGEDVFKIKHTPTRECQAESRSVHGRRITLVDTPDFFNDRPEEELKPEILRCITDCAPGPHAFFIVLKVEKFTKQEEADITKILQYFSEEALKYVAVVFTHGDQLPEGMKIEEFVNQNKCLRDLVKKCSGRCHVVDNKCWKNNQQGEYRSNWFQVAELLNTTDKILMENKGGCYTNEMLKAVSREIQEKGNRAALGNMPQGHTSSKADNRVSKNVWIKLTGPAAESLVKALLHMTAIDLRETGGENGEEVKEEGEAATETEDKAEEAATEDEAEEATDKDAEDEEERQKRQKRQKRTERKKAKQGEQAGEDGGLGSLFGFFLRKVTAAAAATVIAAAAAIAIAAIAGVGVGVAAAAAAAAAAAVIAAVAGVGVGAAGAAGAAGGIIAWLALKLYPIYVFVKGFLKYLQQHSGIILLVALFFSMLLLSFWPPVPMFWVLLPFLLLLLFS